MNHSEPHVWIVLLNYNGLADTVRCLRSLRDLDYARHSVVVVDNASEVDPRPTLAAEFPECHLLRNPSNGGWAGGNNTGILYALAHGADQVLLLNNDTIVAPDLVSQLVRAAQANPSYGVIGPVIRFMDEPDQVMTDGCLYNRTAEPGFFQRKVVPLEDTPTVADVDIVNGCCMMVGASVFRRIGAIDERFFLVHEESDFCLRVRRAGLGCGVLAAALVWHKGSSTFKQTGRGWQRYFDARNLWLLLHKHARSGVGKRSTAQARWEYIKHVYYRYTVEKEHGQHQAADAVLEGLHDAWTGHYGPRPERLRPAVPLFRRVFDLCHGWRLAHPRPKETPTYTLVPRSQAESGNES